MPAGDSREERLLDVTGQASFEVGEYDREISLLMTRYLVERCGDMFLPIPSRDDAQYWEQDYHHGGRAILTHDGISTLRRAIRAERKENIELLTMILTGLTGLGGVIIGIISFLF